MVGCWKRIRVVPPDISGIPRQSTLLERLEEWQFSNEIATCDVDQKRMRMHCSNLGFPKKLLGVAGQWQSQNDIIGKWQEREQLAWPMDRIDMLATALGPASNADHLHVERFRPLGDAAADLTQPDDQQSPSFQHQPLYAVLVQWERTAFDHRSMF